MILQAVNIVVMIKEQNTIGWLYTVLIAHVTTISMVGVGTTEAGITTTLLLMV